MQYDYVDTAILFKQCPLCGEVWETGESFFNDNSLQLNGFQSQPHRSRELQSQKKMNSVRIPVQGFFIFTHHKAGCGTSLIVSTASLQHIHSRYGKNIVMEKSVTS